MLYLLDANVLITAHNKYYPLDAVPEFWDWLIDRAASDKIKIPIEIIEEIKEGRKDDLLYQWISDSGNAEALLLGEDADPVKVDRVIRVGYAAELTDDEIEAIGRDPFLISYALETEGRTVVTVEVSKPSRKGKNRKIPDVCDSVGVRCIDPFELNAELGFRTAWRA